MGHQVAVHRKGGGAVVGALWMFFISLLLFWLPVFGPLIAGFVGGKKAGGVGAALGAVFLPALVFGIFFFVFGTALTFMPLAGALAGAGGFVVAVGLISGPLLIGAIIGGALA
ncbi:MAG: hypothetical protein JSW27_10350 [Phycisphaerales bacterium]|nr:MAG: hypothetical protein JSW27_10350 [Phycisphaerales bacterium]